MSGTFKRDGRTSFSAEHLTPLSARRMDRRAGDMIRSAPANSLEMSGKKAGGNSENGGTRLVPLCRVRVSLPPLGFGLPPLGYAENSILHVINYKSFNDTINVCAKTVQIPPNCV